MQRIIEYKKQAFWSNSVDTEALNKKIAQLNKDGWSIKSITPNNSLFGIVRSYSLLIELVE